MKKYLLVVLALCLCGCAKIEEALELNQPVEEEEVEEEEVVERSYAPVWAVEPGLEYDNVKLMTPFDKIEVTANGVSVLVDLEKVGYPQEWANTGYDPNAIIVAEDGNHGIINYSAQSLYPASVSIHAAPFAKGVGPARVTTDEGTSIMYGAGNTENGTAFYFSKDYKTIRDVASDNYDYDPYDTSTKTPYVAIKDNKLGVVTPKGEGKFEFEKTDDTFPGSFIAPVVDGNYHISEYKVCDENGAIISDIVAGNGPYLEGTYVNGFYCIGSSDAKTLINATEGFAIGDYSYQDTGFFSDGYCPVKKYGKWGYIDRRGNEVTDFVFDNATSLYDGKGFVLYGDTYGILDIKGSVENDIPLTLATCYHIPEEEPIGVLEIFVKELTIRGGAGTEYSSVGNSHIGAKYNVFETKDSGGYTWYRISNYCWIPGSDEWVEYSEGETLTY